MSASEPGRIAPFRGYMLKILALKNHFKCSESLMNFTTCRYCGEKHISTLKESMKRAYIPLGAGYSNKISSRDLARPLDYDTDNG